MHFFLPSLLQQIMFQIKITLQKLISKTNPSLFIYTQMQNRIVSWNWALISFPKFCKAGSWRWTNISGFPSPSTSCPQGNKMERYFQNCLISTNSKHNLQQYPGQNCRWNRTWKHFLCSSHPLLTPCSLSMTFIVLFFFFPADTLFFLQDKIFEVCF